MNATLPAVGVLPVVNYGDPTATAVVFLHGFLGSKENWEPIAAGLKHYRCLCLDLPGHGEAKSHRGTWSMEETCRAIELTLEYHHVDRAHLIGYSLGARVTLDFSLTYPERVESLLLESGSPGLETETERVARCAHDDKWATAFDGEELKAVLDRWYDQAVLASARATPEFALHLEERLSNQGHCAARVLRELGLGTQPNNWNALAALRPKALLVTGENDSKFCSIAARMAERNPAKISQAVVPNAGHNVHLEQRDGFTDSVNRWLTSNDVADQEQSRHEVHHG